MKKTIAIISALLFAVNLNANNEKIVKSKISKVTVYSQGAQVHRSSSYSIGTGVTEVILEGISKTIDPKSLQVKATGSVIILDSKYSVFYPEPKQPELNGLPLKVKIGIKALEDSLEDVRFALQMLQDEIDVLAATKNILANNGAIRGQGKVNDSIPLLKEAIEYYTLKMMEINKKMHKLNREKHKELLVQKGMNRRLTDLKNWQNNADLHGKAKGPIHRITVTLKAKESASGRLNISYLVSNAGWTPMYDLRSEIASGNVNLNYKANVYQNTGVDWKNVRLNISTNNPYMNKTKPTLHPWYVDFNIYRNKEANFGYIQTQSRINKPKKIESIQQVPSMDSEVSESIGADQFVQVIDQMISAEFRIDLPYSIKSNNEQHMVLVKNVDLSAKYKYYSVPKYDQSAYLVAQITKLDELQLVPAKANIFFDGSYIGETYLDPTTMDDTLQLSLGKDPNIIVKRTLVEKECKDKVVGTKKERSFVYAIEVKNLKSKTIDLVIQDQIPITQNPDIEIEASDLSKGKLKKSSGIVEWNFSLKPKGKKDLRLHYKIKYDKDKHLPLI